MRTRELFADRGTDGEDQDEALRNVFTWIV